MSTDTPTLDLKSKDCPYCNAPKAVTFSVGDEYEHQCGTTRQRGTRKTIKQSDECKWRVYAASLERERDAARARVAELEAEVTRLNCAYANAIKAHADEEERADALEAECEQLKHERNRAGMDARKEMMDEIAKLKDPVAVHINMLRGTIATPSVELMEHVWGHSAENQTPLDRPDKPLWIPCRHKLPNAEARVWAMYEGVYSRREVTVWYDGGNNVHFGLPNEPDGKGSQPATHWMPLPATPPPVPMKEKQP